MLKYEITGDKIVSYIVWVAIALLFVGIFLYANICRMRTEWEVIREKVSALEDAVWVNGVYTNLKKSVYKKGE